MSDLQRTYSVGDIIGMIEAIEYEERVDEWARKQARKKK